MKTTDNTHWPIPQSAYDEERELNLQAEIGKLTAQRDTAVAALRDIEQRAGYSLARPDKTNNDIQMEYIRQQAGNAIAAAQGGAQ